MRTILYTALFAAFSTLAAAFPTGSPVCVANATTLLAVPGTPMGKEAPNSGFSLTYNFPNNQFTAGKQYKISVSGAPKFNGLLLWSLVADKSHVGQFNLPTGFKYVAAACPGDPKATVTHSDATPKSATDFMWTAPTNSSIKQVQFVAVVVSGTPPQFQVIKDGKMFNAVAGPASTTNGTSPSPTATSGTDPNATTDPNSGYGSSTDPSMSMSMGSATSTGVNPTDSSAASNSAAGSNVTKSSDVESLKGTSSWILFASTLLIAQFLVALV
jgi:hypothetical protein